MGEGVLHPLPKLMTYELNSPLDSDVLLGAAPGGGGEQSIPWSRAQQNVTARQGMKLPCRQTGGRSLDIREGGYGIVIDSKLSIS